MKHAVILTLFILIGLGLLTVLNLRLVFSSDLIIVFCDVGQGDAVYIRTPEKKDILFDGGPDESVLSCLEGEMPFWDRSIDRVILSHPHADHFRGILPVIDRYRIDEFDYEEIDNSISDYTLMEQTIEEKRISKRILWQGNRFRFKSGVVMTVLSPTRSLLEQTTPERLINERSEFASLILLVEYKETKLLLTGDSQAQHIQAVIDHYRLENIDILQVPHHGSRTGLSESIIQRLSPELAVISVGKNSYGHPHPSILSLLSKTRTLRTDKEGNIVIRTDGERIFVDR